MAEVRPIITAQDRACFQGAVIAFGVFDGVHRGHRMLIDAARRDAAERGCPCVILTFDIDPDELFHAEHLRKIMANGQRIDALASCGVDMVAVLPFTRDFAAELPDEFLGQAFDRQVPAAVHVGVDFRFGSRASGTLANLQAWGAGHGMEVTGHVLEADGSQPITATRIRLLLGQGSIQQANDLLGHPYTMQGVVQRGRGEGGDFGFCTANLVLEDQLRVLGDGVYAGYALVDGTRYKAAIAVGVAPTFADQAAATCEVHILDFQGNLYGKRIDVQFLHWLRPMREFADVEELIARVTANIQWVRDNL